MGVEMLIGGVGGDSGKEYERVGETAMMSMDNNIKIAKWNDEQYIQRVWVFRSSENVFKPSI